MNWLRFWFGPANRTNCFFDPAEQWQSVFGCGRLRCTVRFVRYQDLFHIENTVFAEFYGIVKGYFCKNCVL